MYRRYKERFGTAGVVLGVIAIVLAIGGSAIAASGLNGKQKKQVKAIAKSFAGKAGAPGAAGTNGTNGKDGTNGADGADGESVAVSSYEGPECPTEEGAEFTNGTGTAYACNGEAGEEGEEGPEGSPWTGGGTLPSGATLTGAWALEGGASDEGGLHAPISFSIPLAASIPGSNTLYITSTSSAADKEKCDDGEGTAGSTANPEADQGFLCVFQKQKVPGSTVVSIVPAGAAGSGAGVSGAFVAVSPPAGTTLANGTWAVTAP